MYITRAYNRFEINNQNSTITKISKEEKLSDEILYYLDINDLDNKLGLLFPRVLDYTKDKENYKLTLERYAYRSLGDLIVNEEISVIPIEQIIECILNILHTFKNYRCSNNNVRKYREQMYIEKTLKEYNNLINNNDTFSKIIKNKELNINGKKYLNFSWIWDDIVSKIKSDLFNSEYFTVIHGDFCFSNILCGVTTDKKAVLRLIDPRGSFGRKGIYGDQIYDYAKLRHSFEGGYEYIIYDKFNLVITNINDMDTFEFGFINDNLQKIQKKFSNIDIPKSSKLVEGLIFVGMCARHYDSLERQIVMYLTGIKLLNEYLLGE